MACVPYARMREVFERILLQEGLAREKAIACAAVLADNTLDGVHSHGVNRFLQFADRLQSGDMDGSASPEKISAMGGMEQWDGRNGIGPLNAIAMMDRAMHLADTHGLGLVALRNTTHWMRGATYGYQAVERGYSCICWTNAPANMPAWQTTTEAIGNNPIVMGIAGKEKLVVLDMAMSQYSYGKLETTVGAGEQLSFEGGYDSQGKLTRDPAEILATKRMLPVGLWKGSGLSIIGDLFVSALSHGTSTVDMPAQGERIAQFFLAIHPGHDETEREHRKAYVDHVIKTLKANCMANGEEALYPGEGSARRKARNALLGIEVRDEVWDDILRRRELRIES